MIVKIATAVFRILVYLLAVVGVGEIAAQGYEFVAGASLPPDAAVVQRLESPDKHYQVVVFNRNGGPRSPFCMENATLSPVGTSDKADYKQHSVTMTGCGGITSIRWKDNTTVAIKLDLQKGNANSDTTLRGSSQNLRVKVDYGLQ